MSALAPVQDSRASDSKKHGSPVPAAMCKTQPPSVARVLHCCRRSDTMQRSSRSIKVRTGFPKSVSLKAHYNPMYALIIGAFLLVTTRGMDQLKEPASPGSELTEAAPGAAEAVTAAEEAATNEAAELTLHVTAAAETTEAVAEREAAEAAEPVATFKAAEQEVVDVAEDLDKDEVVKKYLAEKANDILDSPMAKLAAIVATATAAATAAGMAREELNDQERPGDLLDIIREANRSRGEDNQMKEFDVVTYEDVVTETQGKLKLADDTGDLDGFFQYSDMADEEHALELALAANKMGHSFATRYTEDDGLDGIRLVVQDQDTMDVGTALTLSCGLIICFVILVYLMFKPKGQFNPQVKGFVAMGAAVVTGFTVGFGSYSVTQASAEGMMACFSIAGCMVLLILVLYIAKIWNMSMVDTLLKPLGHAIGGGCLIAGCAALTNLAGEAFIEVPAQMHFEVACNGMSLHVVWAGGLLMLGLAWLFYFMLNSFQAKDGADAPGAIWKNILGCAVAATVIGGSFTGGLQLATMGSVGSYVGAGLLFALALGVLVLICRFIRNPKAGFSGMFCMGE